MSEVEQKSRQDSARGKKVLLVSVSIIVILVLLLAYGGATLYSKGFFNFDPGYAERLNEDNLALKQRIAELERTLESLEINSAKALAEKAAAIESLKNQLSDARRREKDLERRVLALDSSGEIKAAREQAARARAAESKYKTALAALRSDQREAEQMKKRYYLSGGDDIKSLQDRVAYLEGELEKEINERRDMELAHEIERERAMELAREREAQRLRELASVKEARRVELEKPSAKWSVKAASKDIAFLKSKLTGRTLKVSRGVDVPGCGAVVGIDPENQTVSAGDCIIGQDKQ